LLIDALAGLGLVETPGAIEELPDKLKEGKEIVEDFLSSDFG